MNSQHKAIRALLNNMAPKRAISYISAFELPEEEQRYLIECDVKRKSYAQIMQEYHTTPEVINRRRQRAYAHIADEINNTPAGL